MATVPSVAAAVVEPLNPANTREDTRGCMMQDGSVTIWCEAPVSRIPVCVSDFNCPSCGVVVVAYADAVGGHG